MGQGRDALILTRSPLHVQEPVTPSAGTGLCCAAQALWPQDELNQFMVTGGPAGSSWCWPLVHLPGPACIWKYSEKFSCELPLRIELFSCDNLCISSQDQKGRAPSNLALRQGAQHLKGRKIYSLSVCLFLFYLTKVVVLLRHLLCLSPRGAPWGGKAGAAQLVIRVCRDARQFYRGLGGGQTLLQTSLRKPSLTIGAQEKARLLHRGLGGGQSLLHCLEDNQAREDAEDKNPFQCSWAHRLASQ